MDRTGRVVCKQKIADDQLRMPGLDGRGNVVERCAMRLRFGPVQARIEQRIDFVVKRQQRAGDAGDDEQRGERDTRPAVNSAARARTSCR